MFGYPSAVESLSKAAVSRDVRAKAMIRSPDLSRNDGRYSMIAEFWAREPWDSRRGAAPARPQQRTKSRRNWPGVMPVPRRKARVKLAWEEKFSAMAISRRD